MLKVHYLEEKTEKLSRLAFESVIFYGPAIPKIPVVSDFLYRVTLILSIIMFEQVLI